MGKKKAIYTSDEIKMGKTAKLFVEVKFSKFSGFDEFLNECKEADYVKVVDQKTKLNLSSDKKLTKKEKDRLEKHFLKHDGIVSQGKIVKPNTKEVMYKALHIGNEDTSLFCSDLNSILEEKFEEKEFETKKYKKGSQK